MRRWPSTEVSYSGLCPPCTGSVAGGIRAQGYFLGAEPPRAKPRGSHPNPTSYAGHLGRHQLRRKQSGYQKIWYLRQKYSRSPHLSIEQNNRTRWTYLFRVIILTIWCLCYLATALFAVLIPRDQFILGPNQIICIVVIVFFFFFKHRALNFDLFMRLCLSLSLKYFC